MDKSPEEIKAEVEQMSRDHGLDSQGNVVNQYLTWQRPDKMPEPGTVMNALKAEYGDDIFDLDWEISPSLQKTRPLLHWYGKLWPGMMATFIAGEQQKSDVRDNEDDKVEKLLNNNNNTKSESNSEFAK